MVPVAGADASRSGAGEGGLAAVGRWGRIVGMGAGGGAGLGLAGISGASALASSARVGWAGAGADVSGGFAAARVYGQRAAAGGALGKQGGGDPEHQRSVQADGGRDAGPAAALRAARGDLRGECRRVSGFVV